ncbi:hypothetical protein PEDI_36540 [Persicobacter diffluens]|uniref:Uncharacterized protein n=1 Tax=Persicobacter diffluens TaxID=981 RepID=A0AAN5ALS2_9BACT|nr:hypothetical protein PEDI_36540 [Persicobacter diffluens]
MNGIAHNGNIHLKKTGFKKLFFYDSNHGKNLSSNKKSPKFKNTEAA